MGHLIIAVATASKDWVTVSVEHHSSLVASGAPPNPELLPLAPDHFNMRRAVGPAG
jgi:hypothetical protein